jgi:catechol 2,3-dioxygenase-like lactoylglutathione lyase family enzyme
MPVHLNLTVVDMQSSLAFYRRWLGFGKGERRFPDGTVFLRDSEGTDLAFHAGHVSAPALVAFHFGWRRSDVSVVRDLYAGLAGAGVSITEFDDGDDLVSVKFLDPDGYVVEVYWESQQTE